MVCPQNAKEIVNETEKAKVLIQSGDPVYVSLAPSFIANYNGVGIGAMRKALQALGFCDVEETAIGATIVKREYERILAQEERAIGATMVKTEYERLISEEKRDVIISSCCHSINLLIQKYFPKELEYLADVLSPMQAHCRDIKKRHPEAKTVFIGPCVAKKDEAAYYGDIVDAVLTFEELMGLFEAKAVNFADLSDNPEDAFNSASADARGFAASGGVAQAVVNAIKKMDPDREVKVMSAQGLADCKKMMMMAKAGKYNGYLLEGMACPGGCIAGAGTLADPAKSVAMLNKYKSEATMKVATETPYQDSLDLLHY